MLYSVSLPFALLRSSPLQGLFNNMEEVESGLRELEGGAMALSKKCVQEDSDTVQQMLQDLRLSV